MKSTVKTVAVVALLLFVTACAAGGVESGQAAHGGWLSQLLLGFWHGIIAPITLLVEIGHKFLPSVVPWDIHMYEAHALGPVYDIGFYIGMAGGPTFAAGRRWSRAP